jgi:hypothetical protein
MAVFGSVVFAIGFGISAFTWRIDGEPDDRAPDERPRRR